MAVMNPARETEHPRDARPALAGKPPIEAGAVACAEWLAGLLDRQLDLFGRLDRLSLEQSASVAEGNADALLSILGRRDVVIQEISELSERVGPIRSAWPDLSAVVPERYRRELRARMDAIEAAVRAINERDDADRKAMERERGAIVEELSAIGRARGAMNAYSASSGAASPRFQDRKG